MTAVLALDQGTTGSRALVVDAGGAVVARAYREIPQHYPHPGWVEHDPRDLLDRTVEAAREAIAASGARPVAVGITNQRETVMIWDRKSGQPVARAIVWQDRRTAARCLELASESDRIERATGLVTDPYFSATKLEFLIREHGLAGRAKRGELAAGTVDAWLVWQLTGGRVHATDPTNASRTMLYDIDRREWSEELCALFGVPMSMLPEVRPSSGDFGVARAELLGSALPIRGIAGDQQSALFGQGCWHRGEGKNTYGTGAFVLLHAGEKRPRSARGLLTTIACDESGRPAYALEGAIFIAGAAVQWLRDGLGVIRTADETEALAAGIDSTGGVYFVPALTGLGAPDWEPEARGTIVGITRGTTRAHLARAALEAMAFATDDILSLMAAGVGHRFERLRVDGGATANDWLMQFQADVLGVPVERPDIVETTALGAAGLAGIAAGVWRTADEFIGRRRFTRFAPGKGAEAAGVGKREWRRAVDAALHWARPSSR